MQHYKTYHIDEKPIEITLPKVLVIFITIMLFFVLPAQLITLYQNESPQTETVDTSVAQTTEGRVAGATVSITNDSTNDSEVNRSTMFIALGGFFFFTAGLGIWYLKQIDKEYDVRYRL